MDNDLRNLILGGLALVALIITGIILTPPGEGTIKACGDSCQHTGQAMLKVDRDGCSCAPLGSPPAPSSAAPPK